ncbi:erythromycin esterase family protein [Aquimarina rhabdastrellae]
MKKTFTLILCLFFTIGYAQELKTKALFSPESKELSDLSFLQEELRDKNLVMLGEITHMYGNIFEMKARIIEYLHQELGYTTIAMESSMYDIWKMNKNKFDKDEFNNVIWGVWSATSEFQRLVTYIEKNNLKVIGFDSQVNNTAVFVEDFFDYCEDHKIELRLDEDDLGIMIEGILENIKVEEDDISYVAYEREIKRILKQIESFERNETNYYWKQFIKSLLASSQDAYYNKEEILTTDFGNKNDNIRDKQMADNLLSYIKRNPAEKIVCWADNIHIINDNSSIQKPVAKEFVSMGTHIKNELKDKVYSLATIHANDSLFDFQTRKWHPSPIKKNSFEYELSEKNAPYLFVSSAQNAMESIRETRLLNFIDFTTARLDQLHDGYIFLKKATLPKQELDKMTSVNKKNDLGRKIKQINVGENIVFKGQIMDKETNAPIPFATLILKNEEIYRVADENGFFKLSINKSKVKKAIIEISSLGFNTHTIAIEELKDKVYLKPKFEELEEVVITGFLTPKAVLKKAIAQKKENHPVEPFNFFRYGKVLINKDDTTALDLELITKDYDDGYLSPFIITQRVEQIKWNKNNLQNKFKYSSDFFSYRQNAIRYANILHKRKYKKFGLKFIKSNNPEEEHLYIISFTTERNKWNYTNRGYPTKYSGSVYIDKESFAIVKVVEHWETTLKREEIEKYFKGYSGYENINQRTIKEENVCYYATINDDGKYYATRYFNRRYNETTTTKNKKIYTVFELDSRLFDFETKDVEEIEYEWREKDQTVLDRVDYDESFWNTFYAKKINNFEGK